MFTENWIWSEILGQLMPDQAELRWSEVWMKKGWRNSLWDVFQMVHEGQLKLFCFQVVFQNKSSRGARSGSVLALSLKSWNINGAETCPDESWAFPAWLGGLVCPSDLYDLDVLSNINGTCWLFPFRMTWFHLKRLHGKHGGPVLPSSSSSLQLSPRRG